MGQHKAAILAVSSIILLLAAVVGAQHGASGSLQFSASASASGSGAGSGSVSASVKGSSTLCANAEYKSTCEQTLHGTTTSDPRRLVQHAFNVGVATLEEVLMKSKPIQDAANDPRTSGALQVCKEVLHDAIYDFNRSVAKIGDFDFTHMHDYLSDLKTWLSATGTGQETCLDAFQNTTGDAGEKMKELLKTAGEISSNALAMVTEISKLFSGFHIPGLSSGRTLMDETSDPGFAASANRRLMDTNLASLKPTAVVAQDGSGQFNTIMAAVNTVPKKNLQPFVIHIKAGVYKEYVELPKHVGNIILVGDGPLKTKITGNKNFIDGIGTYKTATLSINGDHTILRDLSIENSAGAIKHQAVALRVSGDMAIIYNCILDGYQDTLYSHSYRQFYRDTVISGTIDFIFGDAQAVFQNCRMVVRKPLENQGCMVTAQGRKDRLGMGALVLQNCTITAAMAFMSTNPLPKAYLGRPWKEFSRTIIMNSNIDGFITPEGWSEWQGNFALDTLYYAEYQNRGAGADTSRRVKWKGLQHITPQIAESFTAGTFIQGDSWIPGAGIPYTGAMIRA